MREELKSCPFCGGVDLKTYRNLVECQNRDCGVCGPDMGMLGMSEEGARQVAVTAWNTRAKPKGDVGADSGLAAADAGSGVESEAEARGWRDAVSAVQYMVVNWLQDCRTESQQTALIDAGNMLVSELVSASPGEWLNTEWRSTQDWMAQVDKLQAALQAHQRADDNHKALVEGARAVLNGDGRDFGLPRELSGNLRSALAAFQSRQEESAPTLKEMDHGEG